MRSQSEFGQTRKMSVLFRDSHLLRCGSEASDLRVRWVCVSHVACKSYLLKVNKVCRAWELPEYAEGRSGLVPGRAEMAGTTRVRCGLVRCGAVLVGP